MKKLAIAAAVLCSFSVASQATDQIVNIPGTAAISFGVWNPLEVFFEAGTYITTPVTPSYPGALYTAYSFGGAPGYGAAYNIGYDHDTGLGFGEAVEQPGQGWSTPEIAFSHSAVGSFTLARSQLIYFGVPDSRWDDNGGGVSLLVTSVPEPETYAMLMAGLGLMGFIARRRSHSAA